MCSKNNKSLIEFVIRIFTALFTLTAIFTLFAVIYKRYNKLRSAKRTSVSDDITADATIEPCTCCDDCDASCLNEDEYDDEFIDLDEENIDEDDDIAVIEKFDE